MSGKRALIVDDSRSARAFLTRILQRYELQVDDVASAEEALEYLNRHRPDVIFMDHLMPGMDGFQALTVIKNDPRTATIPVLMYTSQEGELYLSQARALGAVGVLPKQTQPADVGRALEQLRLLPERRADSGTITARVPALHEAAAVPEELASTREAQALGAGAPTAATATGSHPTGTFASHGLTPEARMQIETLLRDHAGELRRFVTQSLDQHAARVVAEVRTLLSQPAEAPAEPAVAAPEAASAGGRGAALWLGAVAATVAVVAGVLWYRALHEEQAARVAPPVAGSAPARPVALPAPTGLALPGATATPRAVPGRDEPLLVDAVPFGESPLAGARVDHVQALLERLAAGGFHGAVEIRSIPGRYCLQGAGDTVALAVPDANYSKCDQIGNPVDAAATAARESVAFANMLAAQRTRFPGAIDVQFASGSADEVLAPYPATAEALTAGEWNRAAAANNRVEVRARAAP